MALSPEHGTQQWQCFQGPCQPALCFWIKQTFQHCRFDIQQLPELIAISMPDSLTPTPQPQEDPGGEVDKDTGDHCEAVPHWCQGGSQVHRTWTETHLWSGEDTAECYLWDLVWVPGGRSECQPSQTGTKPQSRNNKPSENPRSSWTDVSHEEEISCSTHTHFFHRQGRKMKGKDKATQIEPSRWTLFLFPYNLERKEINVLLPSKTIHLKILNWENLSATSPTRVVAIPSANWPTSIRRPLFVLLKPRICNRSHWIER